jgi:hypothetical protein
MSLQCFLQSMTKCIRDLQPWCKNQPVWVPFQRHIEFSPEHQAQHLTWQMQQVTEQFSAASDPQNLCENGFHFSNWCDFDYLLDPKFQQRSRPKTPRSNNSPPKLTKNKGQSSQGNSHRLLISAGCPDPGGSHTAQRSITSHETCTVGNATNRSRGRASHLLDTGGREVDVHGEDPDVLALLHLGDRDPSSSSAAAAAPAPSTACEVGSTSRRLPALRALTRDVAFGVWVCFCVRLRRGRGL